MAKLFANSGDPNQTPRSAAFDLGLHCLPITLLRVSRLQRVKCTLTFPTLFAISVADKLIFSYFYQTTDFTVSCKLSTRRQLAGNEKSLFSGENEKNISKYLLLIFTQHAKR